MSKILVVDDESVFVESVARMLRMEGYDDVTCITRPLEVPPLLDQQQFDVALLDLTMPELDGLALLEVIKERSPQTECIMVTANEGIPSVIRAIKLGAYDYLVKPITPDQLSVALERALERRRLVQALLLRSESAAEQALKNPQAFADFVTADPQLLRLLHEAELHATSSIPVLITGETGVGKEVLARAIHAASRRHKGPFVPVNMLALSTTLFESEFFGHARGAFTGADRERQGYLSQARGGTLFLDEIGDLPLQIQGKLLRVLQEGEFTPVGKIQSERADVRFVAATNQDLERLVREHKFRKDLFYRLQFAHLHLPPLRDRTDDIALLAAHFLEALPERAVALSRAATELLLDHGWEGNVRELRAVLESAANLAEEGTILASHLRIKPRGGRARAAAVTTKVGGLEPMAEVEKRHILAVYEAVGSNKSQAARTLQIGLQTLHRKLKSYGVK